MWPCKNSNLLSSLVALQNSLKRSWKGIRTTMKARRQVLSKNGLLNGTMLLPRSIQVTALLLLTRKFSGLMFVIANPQAANSPMK